MLHLHKAPAVVRLPVNTDIIWHLSSGIRHEVAADAKCRGGENTSWTAVVCWTVSFLACPCQDVSGGYRSPVHDAQKSLCARNDFKPHPT